MAGHQEKSRRSETEKEQRPANTTVHGIESEALLILLDQEGICASSGSACLAACRVRRAGRGWEITGADGSAIIVTPCYGVLNAITVNPQGFGFARGGPAGA